MKKRVDYSAGQCNNDLVTYSKAQRKSLENRDSLILRPTVLSRDFSLPDRIGALKRIPRRPLVNHGDPRSLHSTLRIAILWTQRAMPWNFLLPNQDVHLVRTYVNHCGSGDIE